MSWHVHFIALTKQDAIAKVRNEQAKFPSHFPAAAAHAINAAIELVPEPGPERALFVLSSGHTYDGQGRCQVEVSMLSRAASAAMQEYPPAAP
jgi:hypothetical protein